MYNVHCTAKKVIEIKLFKQEKKKLSHIWQSWKTGRFFHSSWGESSKQACKGQYTKQEEIGDAKNSQLGAFQHYPGGRNMN